MKPEITQPKTSPWKVFLWVIGILFVISVFASLIASASFDTAEFGNVAVIPITGEIVSEGDSGSIGSGFTSASDTIAMIHKADDNPTIKVILLSINSPGGAPVASSDIAEAVKHANKTTIAVIKDVGASGAYWVASGADVVYAHPLSITGSVGVYGSYIQYSGLMEKYGVSYERIVSGKYKDTGSPYKNVTDDEREVMQRMTDAMHEQFLTAVAHNRNLSAEQLKAISDANVYLGADALKLGLVDKLGSQEDALHYIEQTFNITAQPVQYRKERSLLDMLTSAMAQQSFQVGRGIGTALMQVSNQGSFQLRT